MCNVLVAICTVIGSFFGWVMGSVIITNNIKTKYTITNEDPDQ